MEHVGSLALSKAFFINSTRLLKPGGVSVHTTELLLSGLEKTIEGHTSIWRYKDVEEVHNTLKKMGGFEVFPIDVRIGEAQVIRNCAYMSIFFHGAFYQQPSMS